MEKEIEGVANLIVESKRLVVFTGAGVSTESGIPDFRSPGGLWEKFDPNEFLFHKFLSSEETRERYWAFQRSLWPLIVNAQPNAAHLAIARLDELGKLDCVITQNIDGLHQKAGVPEEKVVELHGTTRHVLCLNCGRKYGREEIEVRLEEGIKAPRCDSCKGMLKPATISFGQAMPERETREAERRSARCDLFLALGSSLVVYPAAQMPLLAKQSGARLVIINMVPTPHDSFADCVILGKAGEKLSQIVSSVEAKLMP